MAKFFGKDDESLTAAVEPRKAPTNGQLTASARVDSLGTKTKTDAGNSRNREWQQRAWGYYDEVGELKYSAGFLGACLSRCTLTIGLPDQNGHVGPVFDDKGNPVTDANGAPIPGLDKAAEALSIIRALKSDIGGQSQMLRAMGINLMVAGEFYLVGRAREDVMVTDISQLDVSKLSWSVYSPDQFRPKDDNYELITSPSATPIEIKGESCHAIRIWREHPRFTDLPDSSVRAVLDILEELVLLTREVRGEALSRLAKAGILVVPEEIQYGGDDDGDDQGDEGDPFTRDLITTMSTAISDKTSAAGVVPFVIRAPLEMCDAIRLIDFPQSSSDSANKRAEAVQRFAQGVDLPVEIVTGHAGTTFANAVVIDDSLSKSHVEPVLEIIVDALTVGVLRPLLNNDTPLVVHYDASELVTRPNRSQDAKDAYDRNELSGTALRASMAFSESDRPDQDEIDQRIANKKATQSQPFGNANGSVLDQGNLTQGNNLGGELTAAAEVTVQRAVHRAGAKIRGKANSTIRASLHKVPDADVAASLGQTKVSELMSEKDLFHGEFDVLWSYALRRTNGDREYADRLRDACLQMATEALFRPSTQFLVHLPVMELTSA